MAWKRAKLPENYNYAEQFMKIHVADCRNAAGSGTVENRRRFHGR